MKKKTSLIVALSSIIVCALFAAPAKINYQGLITNTAGEPIESSTNTVTVTLYQVETDGTSVYTESFTDVASDADGIYSIQIGDTNLQAVLEATSELWLELIINEQTLSPRQEINSVPYALVADSANRLINASDSSISGDLSVSGNSAFSGNSSFGNDINVMGRVDATEGRFHMLDVMGRVDATEGRFEMLDVMGHLEMNGFRANFEYAEEVRVPTPDQDNEATNKAYVDAAVASAVSGDISASSLTTSGDLSVSGNSTFSGNSLFGNDINVGRRVEAFEGRFEMLDVMGHLEMNGFRANFEYAEEVRVPTPDQDNEATNKAYVDSLVSTSIASDNARGLVQLAVTENVSNISEYYLTYESSGSTLNPAQGDLVLLTGQTTASENGIYEVSSVNLSSSYSSSSSNSGPTASDYYVSLTRASNFDSADEFVTGSFVFVEKGAQLGQGYVLGELASEFALGTSALNYIQFTVDTTSDVAFDQSVSASSLTTSGDLSVSGNSTFSGNSLFGNDINVGRRVEAFEGRFEMLDVMGHLEMNGFRANFEYAEEVRVPTPDQDNEATNKAYVDAAVASAVSGDISASSLTTSGDLSVSGNSTFSGNSLFGNDINVGRRVEAFEGRFEMLDVMGHLEMNGFRANFEYAEEVRVPTPDQDNEATNKAYVDAAVASAVSGDISASSLTTSGDLSVSGNSTFSGNSLFGNDINVGGRVEASDGRFYTLDVMGHIMAPDIHTSNIIVDGNSANFEYAEEVRVPTPDQDHEATNKAYVDAVVVPSGGLVAWSSASPLPNGWSNAGLSSPMPNYIWIIKD